MGEGGVQSTWIAKTLRPPLRHFDMASTSLSSSRSHQPRVSSQSQAVPRRSAPPPAAPSPSPSRPSSSARSVVVTVAAVAAATTSAAVATAAVATVAAAVVVAAASAIAAVVVVAFAAVAAAAVAAIVLVAVDAVIGVVGVAVVADVGPGNRPARKGPYALMGPSSVLGRTFGYVAPGLAGAAARRRPRPAFPKVWASAPSSYFRARPNPPPFESTIARAYF